jgi:hypothetical protein
MITKKWVEEKIDIHRRANTRTQDSLFSGLILVLNEVGGKQEFCYGDHRIYCAPNISVLKKIDAICAYLGIEIVKEGAIEKIVAKKIKKAK